MLLKIKRFQNNVATTRFTLIPGKMKLLIGLHDVVDADDELTSILVGTGQFEPANEDDVNEVEGGRLIDMDEVNACKMVWESEPAMVKFNPTDPKNLAIERLANHYGGVANIPEEIRERLLARGADIAEAEEVLDGPKEAAAG
jgi:hypothetical protein